MTVVWLDVLTPKQFWFFKHLGVKLAGRGFRILATARAYEQVLPLLPKFGSADVVVVGEFGGKNMRDKLVRSAERTLKLMEVVDDFDCAVSSGSPECSRIAFGLAKPHILVSDTPHSPVNRIAAPLSSHVLSPWVIGKTPWVRHGVPTSRITLYRALDPVAWLKEFRPDDTRLRVFGLNRHGYVLVRSPEYQASYLNQVGWRLDNYVDFLEGLAKVLDGLRLVVLPRYPEEVEYLGRKVGGLAFVVEKPVDDLSLLFFSRLFIGGGGTMTQEAALLGVPTISFYPGSMPAVINYLIKQGLVRHVRELHRVAGVAASILHNIDEVSAECLKKASRLLDRMENPADKTADLIGRVISGG
ncbi:MAG: DUF354 domain-containing protein [Candidatus Caldarchaeum sp.]